MLVRKQCDNPTDYFNKMFVEYQEGFSANGNFKKAYLIIVADAADAVSVNFSDRCKFLQI